MIEEWRPVVGYEDRYLVSDLGRVWSLLNERILRPAPDPKGYLRCELYLAGKGTTKKIHQLVLEAFVGPRPPEHEGAHDDGDPANNRLSNLLWKTSSQNKKDQIRHGTLAVGEDGKFAKLTNNDVVQIRRLRKAGAAWPDIHKQWPQVRRHTVISAGVGTTFASVSEPPASRSGHWLRAEVARKAS